MNTSISTRTRRLFLAMAFGFGLVFVGGVAPLAAHSPSTTVASAQSTTGNHGDEVTWG